MSPAVRVRRPWSLTARLVGLQVLTVALLTGGAFAFLLASISDDIDEDNRDDLVRQAGLLRKWLEDPKVDAGIVMRQINTPLNGQRATPLSCVRILDASGSALFALDDPSLPPAAAFAAPNGEPAAWHPPGGPHYLLMSFWANLGASRQQVQLQMAFDVTDDKTLVRKNRQVATVVLAVALVVSAGLAWLITQRALRPLKVLAESAARVQASRLSARLDETGWPMELTSLAGEFDAMLGRLDSSFRRLARFSSDLSHELRTPINNLRGEAEVALNRTRTPEEYRAVLESSLEEFARITRLIDTLLFIAKADQPERSLARVALEAAAECRAVVEFFEAASAERNLTLLVRGSATIYCDPMLFRRALSNLVDNALRHTPGGGHIDLAVRAGRDGGTEVEVSDSGAGISAEHLPHVFERFYQAGKQDDEAAPAAGFGLGLAIVKSIMELHGGRAEVASTVEHGTTITLFFPGPAAVT